MKEVTKPCVVDLNTFRAQKAIYEQVFNDLVASFDVEKGSRLYLALERIIYNKRTPLKEFLRLKYHDLIDFPGVGTLRAIEVLEFQKVFLERALEAAVVMGIQKALDE